MYKKILIHIFAYGSIGLYLSRAGVYPTNFRFWAILLCVVLVQLNEHVN